MRKYDSLRLAIETAIPELQRNPAALRIWIEKGTGQSRQTATRALSFAYQLNLLLVETAADLAVLSAAIFEWLRINQPERLAPGADGFAFDADILDNQTADILIQIDLTENVSVTRNPDGTSTLTWLAEPDPLLPDADETGPPLAGADAITQIIAS